MARMTAKRVLTEADKLGYITTTHGMSGFFAVWMKWYDDDPKIPQAYQDVYTSGIGRYATRQEAVEEAKVWAEAEGVPYNE